MYKHQKKGGLYCSLKLYLVTVRRFC